MQTKERFAVAVLLLAIVGVPMPQARVLPVQAPIAPVIDVERLRVCQERIVKSVVRLAARSSLAELLPVVLRVEGESGGDGRSVDDHRAALLAMAFYVNSWPLATLVPDARAWPAAERRTVLLRGRQDLARHFAVSAAVSAFAGTAIANALGLSKEMDDVRRASGFSFSDLAADRAGTVFGEAATRSDQSARRLLMRVGAGLAEDDIMPPIGGLPDNLTRAEFTRRYGGVGAPAYTRLVDEIDRRVAALTLFR